MPGWLYVDTGVKSGGEDTAVTILRVEEESKAFVPAGRWTQGGELTFFNTSGEESLLLNSDSLTNSFDFSLSKWLVLLQLALLQIY